ncbi:cysteine-rich receptor-like protein kinase, partial [Trifolium medium]|nr:cysteine-rich receptor-like protein kinase [Trifolium medium]
NPDSFGSVRVMQIPRNALSSILVDGVRVEGVQSVHQAVFSHFSSHFRVCNMVRPSVDDLQFNTLTITDSGRLVRPFSADEVKAAVWDCDSYKSPGP